MKAFRIALCALVFAELVQARPIVIEETATLSPPDASWRYFGRAGVAIDGDFALVSGERFIDDPNAEGGVRGEGAAFLYQRSGSSWNYVGLLGQVFPFGDALGKNGLAMKNGVAMTVIGSARIFERTGTTWTQSPTNLPFDLQGPDIEIDAGRILVPRFGCTYESAVVRKISGTWSIEGELHGHSNDCVETSSPPFMQDIRGTRAIVHNPPGFNGEPVRVRQYRLNENGVGWREFAEIEHGPGSILGPEVAMAGTLNAITGNRDRGTSVAYEASPWIYAWADYGLQPADGFLQPDPWSATGIEGVGATMFAQRNYSFDRKANVINLFRVNSDEARSSTHLATLQTRSGASPGTTFDASANRIIVNGYVRGPMVAGNNTVRIFELPASFEHPAVQVHDFEAPTSGAAWQPAAGSTFSIGQAATTRVYRQTSTAGESASWLPSSTAHNQAIQSEVIIRAVAGAEPWVGLTTRRSDDANYYYVTLRASGTVELKRMLDGEFITLASAPATVTTGHRYRLRLESIGTVHRVYLDDRLVLTARDAALAEGAAGIIMYRARADYDNVIVTPSPFTTIYTQNFSTPGIDSWNASPGLWQSTGGVFRQSSTVGYGRAFVGAGVGDQIVQARVRPTSFAGPDDWVGVMARYQDPQSYLYVSLRNRGVISLWRRSPGMLQNLANRPFTVTTGTWYVVRVEVVGGLTRVFVNNQLQLSSNADPGPSNPYLDVDISHVGLITNDATADFDNFFAYQP